MANQFGNITLAAYQISQFGFTAPKKTGFLPVISVIPLTPSYTAEQAYMATEGLSGGVSFPQFNQLGVSTLWSRLSDDSSTLIYYMIVINFSNSAVEFAFVEASL